MFAFVRTKKKDVLKYDPTEGVMFVLIEDSSNVKWIHLLSVTPVAVLNILEATLFYIGKDGLIAVDILYAICLSCFLICFFWTANLDLFIISIFSTQNLLIMWHIVFVVFNTINSVSTSYGNACGYLDVPLMAAMYMCILNIEVNNSIHRTLKLLLHASAMTSALLAVPVFLSFTGVKQTCFSHFCYDPLNQLAAAYFAVFLRLFINFLYCMRRVRSLPMANINVVLREYQSDHEADEPLIMNSSNIV